MKQTLNFTATIVLVFLLSACGFQKTLKNPDVDEKYKAALEYYNKKDYSRALQLFDQISGAIRGTEKSENLYYYYAFCYFNQKDYTLGAYYFKRFYTNFPSSTRAEECLFMSAYCNYLNSPDAPLDQTNTYEALKELQMFINEYPKSKRVPECNDLIDKLRAKLEYKDYRIAKMYYKMGDYAAASTSMNNILKDYPETSHREEIMFQLLKVYSKYADESIEIKKQERYTKAVSAYKDLVKEFPQTKYLDEANTLYNASVKGLESLKSNQNQN